MGRLVCRPEHHPQSTRRNHFERLCDRPGRTARRADADTRSWPDLTPGQSSSRRRGDKRLKQCPLAEICQATILVEGNDCRFGEKRYAERSIGSFPASLFISWVPSSTARGLLTYECEPSVSSHG